MSKGAAPGSEKFYRHVAVWAAVSMALAVAAGALGAHTLREVLSERGLQAFETGVRYQLIHSLALFIPYFIYRQQSAGQKGLRAVSILFALGILCFSGSIYALSTAELWSPVSLRWLGPVTPLGGLCFIAGWLLLATRLWRTERH